MIRVAHTSTQSWSSAASDVSKRRVIVDLRGIDSADVVSFIKKFRAS